MSLGESVTVPILCLLTFLHLKRIAKATGLSYAGAQLAARGVGAIVCILQMAVAGTMT